MEPNKLNKKEVIENLNYVVMLKCVMCEDFPVAAFIDREDAKKYTRAKRTLYYIKEIVKQ